MIINRFWNPYASILPNKWRFNLSPDWEIFALDFESFSTDNIANETFWALGLYIFTIEYLKEGFLYFTDVTDLELNAKPIIIDNSDQVVIGSKKEVVKKKNKYAANRLEWLVKICVSVKFSSSPCFKSSFFCHFVLYPPLCSLLWPLLYPLLCPLLCLLLCLLLYPLPFLVLHPPLFCRLVIYLL